MVGTQKPAVLNPIFLTPELNPGSIRQRTKCLSLNLSLLLPFLLLSPGLCHVSSIPRTPLLVIVQSLVQIGLVRLPTPWLAVLTRLVIDIQNAIPDISVSQLAVIDKSKNHVLLILLRYQRQCLVRQAHATR